MPKAISAKKFLMFEADRVIHHLGGPKELRKMDAKDIRKLIKCTFSLELACRCDREVCVCPSSTLRRGEKYRRDLYRKLFLAKLKG